MVACIFVKKCWIRVYVGGVRWCKDEATRVALPKDGKRHEVGTNMEIVRSEAIDGSNNRGTLI